MAHDIIIDGERQGWHAITDIGLGGRPQLRVHRLDSGDLLVIGGDNTTRDGVPLLGNCGIVPWGTSALLRSGTARIEIVWQAHSERRTAGTATRCRLCFGGVAAGEAVVRCSCAAVFHEECDAARVNCPACGLPRQGDAV